MRVTQLDQASPRASGGRHVAIGTFDGVHLGHRAVIGDADTVLTFEPHPLAVIKPEAMPKLLMPFDIRRDVISGLGAEELVVIPFDRSFQEQTAEQFVDDVLIGRLGATLVSVGENFRFGKGARGDAPFLAARPEFDTRVVPMVEVEGETVSSTQIRALVAAGSVTRASHFMAAPFMLEGEVVSGDRRGRELGMPTANIVPDPRYACPGHGVYAAWAHGHAAAVNVGVRPTFETGRGLLVESYLLDFDGDLYGETLRVAFIKRLRGEKRFESVDALVDQMRLDVAKAREIASATVRSR
jgi:riboflavin kinase/FMN adenylyltransferase